MTREAGRDADAPGVGEALRWAFPLPFERLPRRQTPNDYLVLPPEFASVAAPHRVSPVFNVGVDRLEAAWRAVVAQQPRVTATRNDAHMRQFEYVQRSRVFRFPDVITVRLIALERSRSTLALYSRSRYGRSDLGVNRRRVEAWLEQLGRELGGADHHATG